MMVVSKLKHLAKYGTIVVALLAICSIVSLSAHAQTMGGATSTSSTRQIICGDYSCTIGDPGNGGHQRVCWEAKRPNRIKKGKYKCFYTCQGAGQEAPKDCKKEKYTCRKVTVSTVDCEAFQGEPTGKQRLEQDYTEDELNAYSKCTEFQTATSTCKCGSNKICFKGETCDRVTYGSARSGGYYNVCIDKSVPVCKDSTVAIERCRCGGNTRDYGICEEGEKCLKYNDGKHKCVGSKDSQAGSDNANGLTECPIDTPITQNCQCGIAVTACGVGFVCTEATLNASTGSRSAHEKSYTCIDPKNPPDKSRFGNDYTTSWSAQECPTYAQYVEKYGSGCWSCLVLEKLTSSFLSAASAGLKICQEAGIILLILGFAIWLAFWALKNVSSFTEIKGSNILNDLLKIGAKVVLAYCCITAGPTAIREFVITPIIGIGATIAQNFWYTPDDAKASGVDSKYMQGIQAEGFDWDMPLDIDQEAQNEATEALESPPEETDESERTEEQQDIAAMDAEINEQFEIPAFQIPGVNGSITSFPGCRIPPKVPGGATNGPNCGSYAHMGLDVGAPEHSKIWAMAGGKITYQHRGWGAMATIRTIQHTKNGDVIWDHLYAHMNCSDWQHYKAKWDGKEVTRGEIIGGVGGTSKAGDCSNYFGAHLHVEIMLTGTVGGKTYQNALLDPVSLAEGKILVRGHKDGPTIVSNTVKKDCDCRVQKQECKVHADWNNPDKHKGKGYTAEERCKAAEQRNKSFCHGFASPTPNTILQKGSRFPLGGVTTPGTASVDLSGLSAAGGGGGVDYGSMRVEIPDVKYTGPTDIMPKSVMNSILGATKAITFNVAQYQILGEMVMCYSQVRGGGAHHIDVKVVEFYWTNFGMWIAGAILWFLGFMLTSVISFYLVDMSFKIGFAVMALPIVMGLWPFKATQGKLAEVVAIIAKASCDFAFLALTTYFGLNLVAAVYGSGIEGLFNDYDKIIMQAAGSDKDEIVNRLNDTFYLFSSTFLLLLFAIIYAYKLVSQTSKDLVEKFFPDGAFGNVSPMHKALTGAASIVNRLNKKYGMGLAGDIAANQLGKGINKLGGKATGAVAAAPKAALNLARRGINKLKGGGKK